MNFNIIYKCSNGNILEWHSISWSKRRFFRHDKRVSRTKALWRDNISLFSVSIGCKRDKCSAVRIVFNRLNFCGNIKFIVSKINIPEKTLVSAAFMPNGNAAHIVSSHMSLAALSEFFKGSECSDHAAVRNRDSVAL